MAKSKTKAKDANDRHRAGQRLDENDAQTVSKARTPQPLDQHVGPTLPNVLPAPYARWAAELSVALQCDVSMPIALALSAMATAVGGARRVQIQPGHVEPTNLYALISLKPGERKSPAFAAAAAPIAAWEAERVEEIGPAVAEAQARRSILEQRAKDAQRRAARCSDTYERMELQSEAEKLARELAEQPDVAMPQRVVGDTTPEALGVMLSQQGERLALLSGDSDLFHELRGRYSENPNFDLYLKAWCSEEHRVNRIGREPVLLRHPALTICVCTQPSVLAGAGGAAGGSLRQRGLLSRFVYVLPPSALGHRQTLAPPMSDVTRERYARELRRLLDLEVCDRPLELSGDALGAWAAFADRIEAQLGADGSLAMMADWAAKVPGLLARVAALLHLGDGSERQVIGGETMARAVKLVEAFTYHAVAAFKAMGCDPSLEAARLIVRWLRRQRSSTFRYRDGWRALRGSFPKDRGGADAYKDGLQWLVDSMWIGQLRDEDRKSAGRPDGGTFEVCADLSAADVQPKPVFGHKNHFGHRGSEASSGATGAASA